MEKQGQTKKKKKPGRKPTGPKGEKRTVYISPEINYLLEKEAGEQHRSVSKMLEFILRERYGDIFEKYGNDLDRIEKELTKIGLR